MSRRDFINANFVLAYKRPFTRIMSAILILFIMLLLLVSLFSPDVSFTDIIVPVLALFVVPLLTYWRAKNIYDSNKRSGESVEYIFDKEYLIMKGESFNAQVTWDKLYRVTQSKNWVFVWQNRQSANPIPKRDIWEGEILNLKQFLDTHHVKNNL